MTCNVWRDLRKPSPGLVDHSDRGSQYCSADYRLLVKSHDFIASISGRGNCFDNALVETVFKTIRVELIWRTAFGPRDQASISPAAFEVAYLGNNREEQMALH